MERRLFIVTGQVQGVGFRPFVYRLALACGLSGHVGNTPEGVRIEVQGAYEDLDVFARGFVTDLPPLVRITALRQEVLPVVDGESVFIIAASSGTEHAGHTVLVSPDMAVCQNCLHDMLDPDNRRYGYAFTNCTDCGPRYSITRSIPYDRPFTSMACFPLCDDCRREYENPFDRRFHAQPNACPVCGPKVWLESAADSDVSHVQARVSGGQAILEVLAALRRGELAAIKGLGGFHLACDAFQADAVTALRTRKNRPHKALAVMVADLEQARHMALLDSAAEAALASPERPIVICPRRPGVLPPGLSPDTASIGLVLPYTPLHHLLFHPQAVGGEAQDAPRALVMTSGNAGGEPICLGNREARRKLDGIADVFLLHNRDILVRVDDSVLFPGPEAGEKQGDLPQMPRIVIRRARGFVPGPLRLPDIPGRGAALPSLLAMGAELKHSFCLTRGPEAFVSQHIGDLSHSGPLEFFEETLRHLSGLLEATPLAVVRDAHPDYMSSRLAEEYGRKHGVPVFALQHHFAHIHAVMAEHGRCEPTLGLALDGAGLGDDGSVWGGELLFIRPAEGVGSEARSWVHQRLGGFAPFALPGGEAAIREPWRVAEALWLAVGLPLNGVRPWARDARRAAMLPMLDEMVARGVNCPVTSSCGRLFDAMAALCGLCFEVGYEGQAAVLLEEAQDSHETGAYDAPLVPAGQGSVLAEPGLLQLDSHALFRAAAEDRAAGVPVGRVARRFHRGLVQGLAAWAATAAEQTGVNVVALSGGVMNNRTLTAELPHELRRLGLIPLLHRAYPPGDGCIALGQASWGRNLVLSTRNC